MRWSNWTVLLLVTCSLNALADGGPECLARRARTPAEARQAQDIVAALKAAAGRMGALMADLQAAIANGDAQRIKAPNDELARLQSGGGGAMTFVTIEVNSRARTAPDAGARPIAIAGAAQAHVYRNGPQPRVVMTLGDAARSDKGLSNAQARNMLVSVDGEAAEAFARRVKLGALQAVLN